MSESPDSPLLLAGAAVVEVEVDVDDEVVVARAELVVRATVVDVDVEVDVEELVEGAVVEDDVGWATAIPMERQRIAVKTPLATIDAAPLLARIADENATRRPPDDGHIGPA